MQQQKKRGAKLKWLMARLAHPQSIRLSPSPLSITITDTDTHRTPALLGLRSFSALPSLGLVLRALHSSSEPHAMARGF